MRNRNVIKNFTFIGKKNYDDDIVQLKKLIPTGNVK